MKFREMRRNKQQISTEECIDILTHAKRGVLALSGDDGYPYAVPLNFVYEDGHLYFHCAMEGHKIDAVNSCDKASFCVLNDGEQEPNDWWYHFKSVIVFGRVCVMEDREKVYEKLRLLGNKYFPNVQVTEEEMKAAPRTAVIDLTIEHMTGKRIKEK